MNIILASASPRRKELLEKLGLTFEIFVSHADENFCGSDVYETVKELSRRKARAVYAQQTANKANLEDALIIGCDSVVYHNNIVLGKPENRAAARAALASLSGDKHFVISGLTLLYGGEEWTDYEETAVYFDTLSEAEIAAYIATGEADDKAGSYGIQGRAAKWVSRIEGCYNNVVGLPTHLMYQMAKRHNIPLF